MCLLVMSIPADELSTPAWQRAIVVSTYKHKHCRFSHSVSLFICSVRRTQYIQKRVQRDSSTGPYSDFFKGGSHARLKQPKLEGPKGPNREAMKHIRFLFERLLT